MSSGSLGDYVVKRHPWARGEGNSALEGSLAENVSSERSR